MTRSMWLVLMGTLGVVMTSGLGSLGLVDYDESVYAQVSSEMLARGDMLNPTLQNEGWYEKPPFLYWTQMVGYAAFGKNTYAVRILNVLAVLLGAFFLVLTTRTLIGEHHARWAGVMFATSAFIMGMSQLALTDMWLTTWMVLAVGAFAQSIAAWEQSGIAHKGWWAIASVACGLAMLTKGAIGLVLPAGALFFYLVFTRQLRFLRHVGMVAWGLLIALLIGLSWYLMLGLTSRGGFSFMGQLFWDHHVGRFLNPMQGHKGPIYFYLPVVLIGLIPWIPYVLGGLGRSVRASLDIQARRVLLLFGSFAALTLVFFSVAATKLPNYAAPVFPAFALFGAVFLMDEQQRKDKGTPLRSWLYIVHIAALVGVAGLAIAHEPLLAIASKSPHKKALMELPGMAFPFDAGAGPYVAGAIALFVACAIAYFWRKQHPLRVAVALAISSLFLLAVSVHTILPRFDEHFQAPLREMAHHAIQETQPDERILLVGVRHRPSVVFYGDRGTEYVSVKRHEKLVEALNASASRVAIMRTLQLDAINDVAAVSPIRSKRGWSLVRLHRKP